MSYIDIIICIGSLPIFETWPPIYRGQERTARDRLKASQVYTHVYFRYTLCLTGFIFEFIQCPISPILSPSSRTFVELTLVTRTKPLPIEEVLKIFCMMKIVILCTYLGHAMFLLYHSDRCNTSETVFYWCYVNDLHTTHVVVCWVTTFIKATSV
jgi:hypothetical protein